MTTPHFLPSRTGATPLAACAAMSATLLLLPGACLAQQQQNAPEVIMGQSRAEPRTNSSVRSPAVTDIDFHARALAPLPQQTYPRKSKRLRKHRLDLDRDGYVSRSEMNLELQARASAFRSADRNQDGKLDAEEQRQYQSLVKPRGKGN